MKKHFLFSLTAALAVAATIPLHAQSAGYSVEEKNRINQEIDSRLGWIGSNWEVAKTSKALKLPNYFAAESSRFFQPGPPAYAQQPEYAEIAGLASIIATELNSVAASEIGKVSSSELQALIVETIANHGGGLSNSIVVKTTDGAVGLETANSSSGASLVYYGHYSSSSMSFSGGLVKEGFGVILKSYAGSFSALMPAPTPVPSGPPVP